MSSRTVCRSCGSSLERVFADLGSSPLSNAFLREEDLGRMEPHYPLKAYVCESCFLVQLEQYETPERIFGDYPYFSSYSDSWIEHCRRYADLARERFALNRNSLVIEAASNDGYLLQFFAQAGIPVLGIEPAENVAQVAHKRGVRTVTRFLGRETAAVLREQGHRADLLIGNNVLAHVPDLNDFVAGLGMLLKPDGVLSLEFPHLRKLIEHRQYDTIYHEHFSYFSVISASQVLRRHGIEVFDVQEIDTHGGSLRVFASLAEAAPARMTGRPAQLLAAERLAGLDRIETYRAFEAGVREAKRRLLRFLIDAHEQGASVAGYGAPAKGNTLLNYCGIRRDLLQYTVDRNPYKQGRYLPGSRIPIFPPARIFETKPDFILILPWNLRDEVIHQLACARQWGARFVIPGAMVEVVP